MSSNIPRRPASSRTSTSRPRKIAGRAPAPAEGGGVEPTPTRSAATEAAPAAPDVEPRRVRRAQPVATTTERTEPTPEPVEAGGASRLEIFSGRRVTSTLMVVLAVLAVVVAGQGVWLHFNDKPTSAAGSAAGTVDIPAGQPPVQMNQSDIDQGIDQAAKDVVTLMSLHYKTYDADVAKALDLTTTHFAAQYKQLTADAKSSYLAKRVDLSAKVIGQGVVRANTTRLQALLFVNQWTTKGVGKGRRLVLTSFRVLMTMVHTNTGWLVDGMDTQ